jgi:PEGA domain-containing protein
LTAVRDFNPTPPSELVPAVPKRLSDTIMHALLKDRDKRYRNCREFQVDLEAVLPQLGGSPSTVELSAYMRQLYGEPGRGAAPAQASAQQFDSTPVSPGPRADGDDTTNGGKTRRMTTPDRQPAPPPMPPSDEPATIIERRPPSEELLDSGSPLAKRHPQLTDDDVEPTIQLPSVGEAQPVKLADTLREKPTDETRVPSGLKDLFGSESSDQLQDLFETTDPERERSQPSGARPVSGLSGDAPSGVVQVAKEWFDETESTASPPRAWLRTALIAVLAAAGLAMTGYALRTIVSAPARPGYLDPGPAVDPAPQPSSPVPPEPAASTSPTSTGVAVQPTSESYHVQLKSSPPGARVERMPDGTVLGETPLTWTVERSAPRAKLQLSLDGYEDQVREVDAVQEREVMVLMSPLPKSAGKRK